METIEPCPVHSDLFEGIVSTEYIVKGAEKRVYIYLVIDFGALERIVSFALCCTAIWSFSPWHSLSPTSYSAHRPCVTASEALASNISQKEAHSLPVALASPFNLDAAPPSASKFESISIEDQRPILQHKIDLDAPFSISSSSESASN